MTSWAEFVQLCCCNRSEFIAFDHFLEDSVVAAGLLLSEPVYVDPSRDALPDLQILVLRLDQIVHTFIVNLNVADAYFELPALILLDVLKNLADRQRNEALVPGTGTFATLMLVAFHGVCLAWARLPVHKYCLVDAI